MIKSASNLRNLIADTEKVADSGETVFARLTDNEKIALDEADRIAKEDGRRFSHEEVFANLRRKVNG